VSSFLGLAPLVLLTASFGGALVAGLAAIGYPILRGWLARLAPARRARLLTALAVAPVAAGAFVTVLSLLPGALGSLWPVLDHCPGHQHASHVHLCVRHLPVESGGVAVWCLVLTLWALFAVPTARQLVRAFRQQRWLRQLARLARRDAELGALVVDTELPLAMATGRRAVLLSASLVRALPRALLDVVLAHERAHLRRGDPTRRWLAAVLSSAHLPSVRRRLLADLELASEQASDEEAAAAVGDRARVARALVEVERLLGASPLTPSLVAAGFSRPPVVDRVEALLVPPRPSARLAADWVWLLVVAALGVASVDAIHHSAEMLVGGLVVLLT